MQGNAFHRGPDDLSNKMGQCLCRKRPMQDQVLKQDKNIDDKRMFKLGIDVLNRDFCIQIGYNRKAVKTYGQCVSPRHEPHKGDLKVEGGAGSTPPSENIVS